MELGKVDSMDAKHANIETRPVDSPDFQYENGDLQGQKGSTRGDVLDMSRMGKKQELQVPYLPSRAPRIVTNGSNRGTSVSYPLSGSS